MSNLFDYLKWRGDLSFTQDPPNGVDALIFSCLAYVGFGGRVEADPRKPVMLSEAVQDYFYQENYDERIRVKNDIRLLREAAQTTRFGFSKLLLYRDVLIPEEETQFAAVTFLLDDGSAFVSFRGTDYSLVGWKEDFNMSFRQTVPAQLLAVEYLRQVAAEYTAPLRIGGHSKGGNLAVFASARCGPMIQERILEVYNNDGPGFTEYMMGDPGYLAIVPRIRTYIPQSSVIGMLLEHEEPYTVIRSKTVSLLQHDPYSWELEGKDFIRMEKVTESSRFMDSAIKRWFAEMKVEERNRLVDVMFGLLGTGGVENALEILHPKNIRNYFKTLSSDSHMRNILSSEFQNFLEAARKTREHMESDEDTEEEYLYSDGI